MHVGLMQKRHRASFGFLCPYPHPIRNGFSSKNNNVIFSKKRQYKNMAKCNPSVMGIKVSGKRVTQGFSPDSSLRARGPHGPAAALKG